ncbi:MAG: transcription termination/antitermination protein NusA [Thiotrichaceae bacterium]|nr:transcription termination/antitermination protein NusA [Thiotrichaceae bacterium]
MNKQILLVVDVVSNEKGVSKEVIFNALECAIAKATKKHHNNTIDVRVEIERRTGDYKAFRCWKVVEDGCVDLPDTQINLTEAQTENPNISLGECFESEIKSVSFDRIGAQAAKQVIVQKIREAERIQVYEAYKERQGELISGVVKRIDRERGNVILDVGDNAEALIPHEQMISREKVRTNDRLRGYLQSVRPEPRGPQLFLSRTTPELLIQLFKMEVPEIGENFIEILGAARDPGLRAKIAVRTKDKRIDPVGACVGMRGSRVQAISNELAGERVDIIIWDENPAQFVMNAMAPADVVSIIVDEETHSMDVAVREDQLSKAIGRNGQNVRLATMLTGWTLNVMTESQATEKHEQEARTVQKMFMSELNLDQEKADILVQEGFATLEEVAYVPLNEMLEIKAFDQALIKDMRLRAKDALLTHAIASEEVVPTEELRTMKGMSEKWAKALATQGIMSLKDLADQAVDELQIIEGMDEAQAGQLIMTARASCHQL